MTRIFITGASSGIGRAVAELALARGWEAGLMARRRDKLEQVSAGRASVYVGDVTQDADVAQAFDAFCESGPLDVLFNNAGMFGPSAETDQLDPADFRQVIDTNVTGMFLCARAAFSAMKRQDPKGGRIINNGSISAQSPRGIGALCYTVSKHAVSGLTKSLSLDGRAHDIACGQIDIGNARTDMVADLAERAATAGAPVLPTMDLDHAAQAVLHMASLPLGTNVQNMTIMATKMPLVGRG